MFKKIKNIHAYEVIDSRGFPTVCCKVTLACNIQAIAMVPSGASTGQKEALELRDGDKKRFNGKGVLKAVENINNIIAPQLIGANPFKQQKIDQAMLDMDGTENKSKLGANAILAVSMAIAKAAAKACKKPLYAYIRKMIPKLKQNLEYDLPVPMLNVINGGEHAANTLDFQEFMFMPLKANSFKQAIRVAAECFYSLQKILTEKNLNTNKGDEGGFAPNLKIAEDALDLMVEAVKAAGYKLGVNGDVAFALDVAASELYDQEKKVYIFKKALAAKNLQEKYAIKTTDQMIEYYQQLTKKYPIISIEDGLAEEDWQGFEKLNNLIGNSVQLVGDDLYCTNPKYIKIGIQNHASNAVLIKLNQIGSLTETLKAIMMTKQNGWCPVISHRSGETEDTFIVDLALATNAGQIKTGSMSRSERIAKYNRLIILEEELGINCSFKGLKTFTNLKSLNKLAN